MKIGLIGFGNAGSKVANQILEFEYETDRAFTQSAMAINSARADLARIDRIHDRLRAGYDEPTGNRLRARRSALRTAYRRDCN